LVARDDDVEEAAARGASAFYADPTRGTSSGLCTNGLRKSVTLFLLREGRERRHSLSLPDVTYLASLDLTLGEHLFDPHQLRHASHDRVPLHRRSGDDLLALCTVKSGGRVSTRLMGKFEKGWTTY
jgi:hypothetical protein